MTEHNSSKANGGQPQQNTDILSTIAAFMLELLTTLIQVTYYWSVAAVLFFLPTSWIAKNIRGHTVLITGAGGCLGSLLAIRFARKGCHLVLWDVNEEMNQATASTVKDLGIRVSTYTVDLSSKDAIYAAAEKVEEEIGRIDIVVNNAGFVAGKRVLEANEKQMQLTMDVNALAHFWMAKAFLKQMVRRNSGHLVTMASASGLYGVPGMADYCASKFAAVGFEETLRQELERLEDNEIKTTVICPFLIKTPMFTGCHAKYPLLMDALEPEYVADQTMDAILRNQPVLYLPKAMYVLACLKTIMPIKCQQVINDFAGSSTLLDTFVGRHGKAK